MNVVQKTEARSNRISVLSSGFGLGFYIPGLLIRNSLNTRGFAAEVLVFESLLLGGDLSHVDRSRLAYHENFQVALASQRIPSDIRKSLDDIAVSSLLDRWTSEDRQDFICLSGHWVHVLEMYRRKRPSAELRVHLLHLDAEEAPSWKQLRKILPNYEECYQGVDLYNTSERKVLYRVETNAGNPIPFEKRNNRVVIHGGGWGIGDYQDRLAEIEANGISADLVGYQRVDPNSVPQSRRYYSEDPSWRTWHLNENGEHSFPPSGVIVSQERGAQLVKPGGYHGLLGLIREARAVVSKPGAGTLIDSLGTATPLVILEPFGRHEQANALLWQARGFGISFKDWSSQGYSMEVLETLQCNLMRERDTITDYTQMFIAERQVKASH